jgi:hypothetical protein
LKIHGGSSNFCPNPLLCSKNFFVLKIFCLPLGCPTGSNECCYVKEVKSNITKKCIFPLKFDGLEHHGCIADDEFGGKFWCSTKVDDKGKHVSGFWGHCGQGCNIEQNNSSERIKFVAFY